MTRSNRIIAAQKKRRMVVIVCCCILLIAGLLFKVSTVGAGDEQATDINIILRYMWIRMTLYGILPRNILRLICRYPCLHDGS